MIGVRDDYRGRGLGRRLLDEVHALCEQSTFAEGVSLTTEEPRNVDFYRRLGYQVVGEGRIAQVVPVWSFFRPRAGAFTS
jgi:ribosomal protein S18 acetylase RimI-like enzyme